MKGGYYVGHIEAGEWLQYTIEVQSSGKYDLELTVSANNEKGKITVYDNTKTPAKNIKVQDTGGMQNRGKLTIKNIPLKQGIHHLRIQADQGGFNLFELAFYYRGSL